MTDERVPFEEYIVEPAFWGTSMNQIQRVKAILDRQNDSRIKTTIDEPLATAKGASWTLDVRMDDRLVAVEWRPRRAFGVTRVTNGTGFGEGPDEILSSPEETATRVLALLSGEARPFTVAEVSLAELRKRENLSQVELAKRLQVTQATISEIEARGLDFVALATVKRAVEALGMRFEMRAVSRGGERFFLLRG